jgi:hypothetical protein
MSNANKPWDRSPSTPNAVTIFGAGIAGLTAAHELVERGFQVQVWEKQPDDRQLTGGCDVGGMARTQWAAVNWPTEQDVTKLPAGVVGLDNKPLGDRRAKPIEHIEGYRFYFPWNPGAFREVTDLPTTLKDLGDLLDKEKGPNGRTPKLSILPAFDAKPEEVKALNRGAADLAIQNLKQALRKRHNFELEPHRQQAADWKGPVDYSCTLSKQAAHRVAGGADDKELAFDIACEYGGERAGLRVERNGRVTLVSKEYEFEKAAPKLTDLILQAGGTGTVHLTISSHGVTSLSAEERRRRAREGVRQYAEAVAAKAPTRNPPDFKDLSDDPEGLEYRYLVKGRSIEVHVQEYDTPDYAEIQVRVDGTKGEWKWQRLWLPGKATSNFKDASEAFEHGVRACVKNRTDEKPLYGQKWVLYVEAAARYLTSLSEQEKRRCVRKMMGAFIELGSGRDWDLEKELSALNKALWNPDGFSYPQQVIDWTIDNPADGKARIQLAIMLIDSFPYQFYENVSEAMDVVITFRWRDRWVPGEHGYRFFPSFYHHVFDTMKRTPLLDVNKKSTYAAAQERAAGVSFPEPVEYVETGLTAFDNLRPTSSHVLAFTGGQRPSQLSRLAIGSFEELRKYLNVLFGSRDSGGFGLDPRDAARMTVKVLQFATSCEDRRRQYSDVSWWDYLGADTFCEEGQELLQKWPEALVAMDAKESDARTQWVPFIQLLLDQVRHADGERYRDGTLRGPTTEAWLKPWRRYLEAQGVEFIEGKLAGFTKIEDSGEDRLWPKVECSDSRYCVGGTVPLRPGYFILAVSADQARDLAQAAVALVDKDLAKDSDLRKVAQLGGPIREDAFKADLAKARPTGDFRHFAGIQYYFAEDVYWIDGHVYYTDSPWSLTSISQARFWQDKMDWEHGYRGILSVIIGAWDKPGYNGKTAGECKESEIAEEVWRQIEQSLTGSRAAPGDTVGRFQRRTPKLDKLPEPLFWHLDQSLSQRKDFSALEHAPVARELSEPRRNTMRYENRSPFFISRPGVFDQRPGDLKRGYSVEHGIVLAGYYTQTYTRVPSMEAANESARHAVNAILRHISERTPKDQKIYRGSFCDIWNPEDREVDDLEFLKDLDQKLFDRGLDHMMEIFELDYLAEHLLRGGPRDPLDPLQLLGRLRTLYRQAAGK